MGADILWSLSWALEYTRHHATSTTLVDVFLFHPLQDKLERNV